jgi:hypothetical protein
VSALDAALVPEYKKVLFSPESDTYNAALRERVAVVASEYGLLQRIEWCF